MSPKAKVDPALIAASAAATARLYLEVLDLAGQPPLFAMHIRVYYDGQGPYLLSGETTGMLATKPSWCELNGRLDLLWRPLDPPEETIELSMPSADAMSSDPDIRRLFRWMQRHEDDRPVKAHFLKLVRLLNEATGVPTVTSGYTWDAPFRPQLLGQLIPAQAAAWEKNGWLPGDPERPG